MKYKGIDISQWQTSLNYKAMAKDLDFVILREGYRKTQDQMFLTHLNGFRSAGVPVIGVYHFLYALNNADAKAEALNCIKNVEAAGMPKTTQIWCDFEYDTIESASKRGVNLGPDECDQFTRTFCDTVIAAGYPTGIYANGDFVKNFYKSSTINKYPLWLADLYGEPDYPCLIHQYSWQGKVSGYSENLDADYYYGELPNVASDVVALEAGELGKGSKGEEVKNLQQKLIVLGYSLDIDGDFGNNTLNAVKNFQSKYGLKVDGIVGAKTMAKIDDLISDNKKQPELKTSTKEVKTTNNVSNVLSTIEKAVSAMEEIAKDDSHGYSQDFRWGPDFDCSSLTIYCWEWAGVPVRTDGATYTGNMKEVFLRNGFIDVINKVNLSTGAGLARGDILLNEASHVAVYCGNGLEVEALSNERGGAHNSIPGDQTGREILIKNYNNKYPWDCVLRYVGDEAAELKKGMRSHAVKKLQEKLSKLGYKIDVDGYFGQDTDKIVREFQKANGLKVDGIVGAKTMDKIDYLIVGKDIEDTANSLINVVPKYVGKVTANKLNVRTGAGTTYPNLSAWPYLEKGNLVDVCDEIDSWLYVKIGGQFYGYVSADYVTKV